MHLLENGSVSYFVDKRESKKGSVYYGLYLDIDGQQIFLCFLTSSQYDLIVSRLSE